MLIHHQIDTQVEAFQLIQLTCVWLTARTGIHWVIIINI